MWKKKTNWRERIENEGASGTNIERLQTTVLVLFTSIFEWIVHKRDWSIGQIIESKWISVG